jgi:hypothetical protein
LALSEDATRLWVPLQGASRVVSIDLNTRTISNTLAFDPELSATADAASPLTPKHVAISPASNEDLLFSYNFDGVIRHFPSLVRAMNDVDVNSQNRVDHLFFTDNPSRAVSYYFNNLQVLSVDALGVGELSEVTDIVTGRHIRVDGSLVYSSQGEIFDTTILAAAPSCTLPAEPLGQTYNRQLGLSDTRNVVYYYRRNTMELLTCNLDSLAIEDTVFIPNVFDGDGFPPALIEAGADRIALLTSTKMALFDPLALPRN